MNYVTSSLSLQMVPSGAHLDISPMTGDGRSHVREWADKYVVGHEGTAQALSKILGRAVMVDRSPISLQVGDELLVCQPVGNRLAPGTEVSVPELAYFYVKCLSPLAEMLSAAKAKAIHNWRVEHDASYDNEVD